MSARPPAPLGEPAGPGAESGADALPDLLADLVDLVGAPAAAALARDFGGVRLYLPSQARLRADHPLVRSVGAEAARRIVDRFGGGPLEVPLGPHARTAALARAIRQRLLAGQSEAQIARACGVHIRTVRRHRAALRTDPRQLSLFG